MRDYLGGICFFLLLVLAIPAFGDGDTALGGWGHFLQGIPRIHLHNPDGEAFTVRMHMFVKNMRQWNNPGAQVLLKGPDGNVIVDGVKPAGDYTLKLEVPEGPEGVYVLESGMSADGPAGPNGGPARGPDFWLETSLDRAVVWTGKPDGHAIRDRWLVAQCTTPRRWWFWVPEDVSSFRVKSQRANAYMSQREDAAVTVFSPRGQRMEVMVGQAPKSGHDDVKQNDAPKGAGRTMSRLIEVEPGTEGRFWCLELGQGDSHHRSNINVTLQGVPSYLARSPESWFNPETGAKPEVSLYEETRYVRGAGPPPNPERWPHLDHWSPAPAIGDPDGNLMRGKTTLAFWNPDGRKIRFLLTTYLPRIGMEKAEKKKRGKLTVRDSAGNVLTEKSTRVTHYHGDSQQPETISSLGEGVRFMEISGPERWWAFTYPGMPTVITGEEMENGWHRFTQQVSNARNYYFRVPEGTESFKVRARGTRETDRLRLEVNAPDRTVEMMYDRKETMKVKVPDGLDGRIWHLRPDVGSGTRMVTKGGPNNRYMAIVAKIDLKGVPPYLAPTWEQWFNPENPAHPWKRGTTDGED